MEEAAQSSGLFYAGQKILRCAQDDLRCAPLTYGERSPDPGSNQTARALR